MGYSLDEYRKKKNKSDKQPSETNTSKEEKKQSSLDAYASRRKKNQSAESTLSQNSTPVRADSEKVKSMLSERRSTPGYSYSTDNYNQLGEDGNGKTVAPKERLMNLARQTVMNDQIAKRTGISSPVDAVYQVYNDRIEPTRKLLESASKLDNRNASFNLPTQEPEKQDTSNITYNNEWRRPYNLRSDAIQDWEQQNKNESAEKYIQGVIDKETNPAQDVLQSFTTNYDAARKNTALGFERLAYDIGSDNREEPYDFEKFIGDSGANMRESVNNADRINQVQYQDPRSYEDGYGSKRNLRGTATELAQSMGTNAPSQMIGGIIGAATQSREIGNTASSIALGVQAGLSSYEEARSAGHDIGTSAVYAIEEGLSEFYTDRILGAPGQFAGSKLGKPVSELAGNAIAKTASTPLGKAVLQALTRLAGGALAEYAQEFTQYFTELGSKYMILGEKDAFSKNGSAWDNVLNAHHSGLLGAYNAILMQSAGEGVNFAMMDAYGNASTLQKEAVIALRDSIDLDANNYKTKTDYLKAQNLKAVLDSVSVKLNNNEELSNIDKFYIEQAMTDLAMPSVDEEGNVATDRKGNVKFETQYREPEVRTVGNESGQFNYIDSLNAGEKADIYRAGTQLEKDILSITNGTQYTPVNRSYVRSLVNTMADVYLKTGEIPDANNYIALMMTESDSMESSETKANEIITNNAEAVNNALETFKSSIDNVKWNLKFETQSSKATTEETLMGLANEAAAEQTAQENVAPQTTNAERTVPEVENEEFIPFAGTENMKPENIETFKASSIEKRAEQFPESVGNVYVSNYNGEDIVNYDDNMKKVYQAAVRGESYATLSNDEDFNTFYKSNAGAVEAMWQAGADVRNEIQSGGRVNVRRENVSGVRDGRDLSLSKGKRTEEISRGSENSSNSGRRERDRRSSNGLYQENAEKVIPNAKPGQTVTVIHEDNDTKESAETRKYLKDLGVSNVVLFNAESEVELNTGDFMRAYYDAKTDTIGIQENNRKEKSISLAKHELVERAIKNGIINPQSVFNKIAEVLSANDLKNMLKVYIPRNFRTMSENERLLAYEHAMKEFICDACAGINQFKYSERFIDLVGTMYEAIDVAEDIAADILSKSYRINIANRENTSVEYSVNNPEGTSAYQRKNIQFNKDKTDDEFGTKLKTVAGTPIYRYGSTDKINNGVGKKLSYTKEKTGEKGSQVYLHKNYATEVIPKAIYDAAVKKLNDTYPGFKYNTLMYLNTNERDVVRFDEAPDFDTAREPIPGKMVAVNVTDNTITDIAENRQIWHHKWLWVKNDYKGFGKDGVKDSWNWSKLWLSVIRDTKNKVDYVGDSNMRIDNKGIANGMGEDGKAWAEQLKYFGLPQEGETVDFDVLTKADEFVLNLKKTQEDRANEPQTDTSEGTSQNQIPASMTNYKFYNTDRVLDWGGGRYDTAKNFMEDAYKGIEIYIYDPFNRTKEHNNSVLKEFVEKPANVITINNVLNVINSVKAQESVIKESKEYLADDGVTIFTIFEGDKSGIGEFTKEVDDRGKEIGASSWQNNLEAAEYVPMVQKYYKFTKKSGNFILASDSEEALKNRRTLKNGEKFSRAYKDSFKKGDVDMKNSTSISDVNNSVEYSVEIPYRVGSTAADEWINTVHGEARETLDLFSNLHEIGQKNKASVIVGVGEGRHAKTIDVTTRNMLAQEWNAYVNHSETFAKTARMLAEALPEDVRTNARISKDGHINPTEFEKEFKMQRSFMQRIVDKLPMTTGPQEVTIKGKTYRYGNGSEYKIGGESYRQELLNERRKQYENGTLAKKSISGLSKDTWGTMGFLASNTKTGASGDFTTFCPQMFFNKGCWYCYRLSAIKSGVNNKLVGENVWYTGEILRLKQNDIDMLNGMGGLRIQSFGDWMGKYTQQLADMLEDAERVGLQIKIITKEPSMIETVAFLKEHGLGKNLYFNLSADYTIEPVSGEAVKTINSARPYMHKDGRTYWKRALTVEEANEFRKKYSWVNTRIVATNTDEFIRGLQDPSVDVVTGYHGKDFAKSGYERVSSETGETLLDVEALGDAGMPRFNYNATTGTWAREFDGKTNLQKKLADKIEALSLQYNYYVKTCCQTGRCASCVGKCGKLAKDFNIKNATNRDNSSVKYWQKNMMADPNLYKFADLLTNEQFQELKSQNNGVKYSTATDDKDNGFAPVFYSKLQRELENYKGDKIGAASVESYLKGKGVKEEEIKWSGIRTFLEGKKSVSKQELIDFAKQNEIKVEEKELSFDRDTENLNFIDEINAIYDFDENDIEYFFDYDGDFSFESFKESIDGLKEEGSISKAEAKKLYALGNKFKERSLEPAALWGSDGYKTKGGNNYREYLYKIPNSNYTNQAMNTHWGEPGVLAHARVQDFTTANGDKVLFIDEIQSDWHNAGAKNGYEKDVITISKEARSIVEKIDDLYEELRETPADHPDREDIRNEIDAYKYELESMGESYSEIKREKEYVDDAPYKTTYTDFVLKNLLRKAAEGGYDYLGWTTGKMQEQRWSSEYAEGYKIEYDQQIPSFLKKYGKQWGATLSDITISEEKDVPAINITDSMKESVLYEGQAQFSTLINDDISDDDINENERILDDYLSETDYARVNKNTVSQPWEWEADRVGDRTKEPMPLSDIIRKIEHDFNVNITNGRIRQGSALATFNRGNKGIRTLVENGMPAISHELGHYFDNTYNLTYDKKFNNLKLDKKFTDELHAALGSLKRAYPKRAWNSEGLAEMIRQYLTNSSETKEKYPNFMNHFLAQLSAEDLAKFETLADEMNAYYSLDKDTATSAIRLRNEKPIDHRPVIERIRDFNDEMYQATVDSMNSIKRFDKALGTNAYINASNSLYADAMVGRIIESDLTDKNGQIYTRNGMAVPSLKDCLNGINTKSKTEYKEFNEYLVCIHGQEWLEGTVTQKKRVFADDRKNNIQFMKKRVTELDQKYPNFKKSADMIFQFIRDFQQCWLVDNGIITQQEFNNLCKLYPNYVPFQRVLENDSRQFGSKRGFAGQNSPIKRAKGSGLDIYAPVDSIIDMMVKTVNLAVRNNVMREICNAAKKYGADATFMEQVDAPLKVSSVSTTRLKDMLSKEVSRIGLDINSLVEVDNIIDSIDDVLKQYGKGTKDKDSTVVTVIRRGEKEFWKVNDPLLLESLTSMSPTQVGGVLNAYAVTTRFLTSMITGSNFVWSLVSNAPRDLGTYSIYNRVGELKRLAEANGKGKSGIAWLAESYGNIFLTYANAIKEATGIGEINGLYREYLAMGGDSTSAYSSDRNLAKKSIDAITRSKQNQIITNILNPFKLIPMLSDMIERGPRFAMYKMCREAGMSESEAFYSAMDVTVNFRRSGTVSKQIGKAVPFFNAAVQSTDKFARFFSADDIKNGNRSKVVAQRVGLFLAVSIIEGALQYMLNNKDDDDKKYYSQLSTYTKNNYFVFPGKEKGQYFCIPKPRELATPASLTSAVLESYLNNNKHAFDEMYGYFTSAFLPNGMSNIADYPYEIATLGADTATNNLIAGTLGSMGVIGVGVDLAANRDFLGRPIVSQSYEDAEMAPSEQYTGKTSKIAKWIGEQTNISPLRIDYAASNTLGWVWDWVQAHGPVDKANQDLTLGALKKYNKDALYSNDIVNWMYDERDKSRKHHTTDIDGAIEYSMDNKLATFYSAFNKLNKISGDRTAKQNVLDMIAQYRDNKESGYRIIEKTVFDVAKKTWKVDGEGSELLPATMNSTVRDANNIQHELTDAQYYDYQSKYNGYYWTYIEDSLTSSMSTEKKVSVIQKAKKLAAADAKDYILNVIGGKSENKYDGVDSEDVISWQIGLDRAKEDDNKASRDEVIDLALEMLKAGTSEASVETLYRSSYDDKALYEWEGDTQKYLTYYKKLESLKDDSKTSDENKEAIAEWIENKNLSKGANIILWELAGYAVNSTSNGEVIEYGNYDKYFDDSDEKTSVIGKYGKGNINLYDRPKYYDSDGYVETVASITIKYEGEYVLIPTIIEKSGKAVKLTDKEAIQHFKDTGKHLGKFETEKSANSYAKKLHKQQEMLYPN